MTWLPSVLGRIYVCAQLALCRFWQADANCCGRCLSKLPGSTLRSTYLLCPSNLVSKIETSCSREGARNHRGNNINYQHYFISVWRPMASHINCFCSCIFQTVNFQIKWHEKKNPEVFIYGSNLVDTISYYCLHEELPQQASSSERDYRAS